MKLHIPSDFARTVELPGCEKAEVNDITRRFGTRSGNMGEDGKEFYALLKSHQLTLSSLAKKEFEKAQEAKGKLALALEKNPPTFKLPVIDCLEFL